MPVRTPLDFDVITLKRDRLPRKVASTQRVYDLLSAIYPLSVYCFHSRAHRLALEMSGIRDGMNVLEVATGSGEMFRRLVRANRTGRTIGLDISPRMASQTLQSARRAFPFAWTACNAVDARHLPFRDGTFDAIFSCYLIELLSTRDILLTLAEFHRVLRRHGTLTLVLIGDTTGVFNRLYRVASKVVPAFWGPLVARHIPDLIQSVDFRMVAQHQVRQSGYPSRVLTARK